MPAAPGPRVVVDTSVLIRYLIKPSAAIKELIEQRWLEGNVVMVTAPELVAELADVLHRERMRRFIQPEEGRILLEAIDRLAERLPPLGSVPAYTRDPKDDKFVACALAARAQCVVTLDKDILVLGSVGNVRMVTPYEMLQVLHQLGQG
jgi:putative PIN family toxin of toxin-antitoxin system